MVDILTPKKRSAFNRALKHKELLPILFRKVEGLLWFDVFEEQGLLAPECNPHPIQNEEENSYQIPSWPITEYLVSSSQELKDPVNLDYAVKYLDLLRDTTKYSKTEGYSNYRTWWQFSKIIRNLPIEIISVDDVSMVEYWFSDEFERGLIGDTVGAWLLEILEADSEHATSMASALIKNIFQIDFVDKKTGSYESTEAVLLYHSYKLDELTKNISSKAGIVLKEDIVEFFLSVLKSMLDKLKYDNWSSVRRPAIEDHEQNHDREEADDIIINCVRESLLGFIQSDLNEAEIFLCKLLDSEYKLVNRIAIYSVDKAFFELSEKTVNNVLISKYFDDNFRHEIWSLLSNHFGEFSEKQKQKTYSIINEIVEYDDEKNVSDTYTAYQKLIWLSAIRQHDSVAEELYLQLLDITKTEPEHPDFSSYSSTGWVVHKSPIELKELRLLSYDDLIITLNDYQNSGGFREPGVEGLTKTFQELIKADAVVISKNLDKFSTLSTPYAYSLISAFSDLWIEKEKTNLEWDKVWSSLLDYIYSYINDDHFWESPDQRNDGAFVANKQWIIGAIGRLLESGCHDDNHSFNVNHIDKTKHILELLLLNTSGEIFANDSDAVSIAINSPRGKCLEAIINLSLFSCRHSEDLGLTKDEIWKIYQPLFDEELSKADSINEYEFATLVTQYLHNFLYLSKDWTLKNLPTIFDQNNYQRWLCAVQGYSYVNRLHPAIYDYLKESGAFIKIFDDENLKDRVDDRYIQFITLEYIYGQDFLNIQNSQLMLLIERAKLNELSQVIWFVWTLRKKDDEKLQSKVYEIWSEILGDLDVETKDGKKLASKLCHFAVFVTVVDDERKRWLLQIAPYSEVEHNSHDLLEVIAKLSDEYPFEMLDIWLQMLVQSSYPYPDEAIKDAFSNLVKLNHKGIMGAKAVATAYLKHGWEQPTEWLSEIINEHKLNIKKIT